MAQIFFFPLYTYRELFYHLLLLSPSSILPPQTLFFSPRTKPPTNISRGKEIFELILEGSIGAHFLEKEGKSVSGKENKRTKKKQGILRRITNDQTMENLLFLFKTLLQNYLLCGMFPGTPQLFLIIILIMCARMEHIPLSDQY